MLLRGHVVGPFAVVLATLLLLVFPAVSPAPVTPVNCGVITVKGKRCRSRPTRSAAARRRNGRAGYLEARWHPSGYSCSNGSSSTKLKFRCWKQPAHVLRHQALNVRAAGSSRCSPRCCDGAGCGDGAATSGGTPATSRALSDRLVDFSKKPPYVNALDVDPATGDYLMTTNRGFWRIDPDSDARRAGARDDHGRARSSTVGHVPRAAGHRARPAPRLRPPGQQGRAAALPRA